MASKAQSLSSFTNPEVTPRVAENPSHTYTKPGNYQVTLQVYNASGYNVRLKTGYIIVTSSKTKIGVFRSNKTWILDASGNGVYGAGDNVYNYGKVGDICATGMATARLGGVYPF